MAAGGVGSLGRLVRRPEELADDEDRRQQPNQSRNFDQYGALTASKDGVRRSGPSTYGPGCHHQTEGGKQPVVGEGLTAGLPTCYSRDHGDQSGNGDAEEDQRQPTRSSRRPVWVHRVSPMLGHALSWIRVSGPQKGRKSSEFERQQDLGTGVLGPRWPSVPNLKLTEGRH